MSFSVLPILASWDASDIDRRRVSSDQRWVVTHGHRPQEVTCFISLTFQVAKYQAQSLARAVVGEDRTQPYGLRTPSGSGDHVGPSAGSGPGGRWTVVWPCPIILKLMAVRRLLSVADKQFQNPFVEDYFFPRPRQITPR